MEIIPFEHQEDYKKILEYINAYKNGITSDSMQSYGIVYTKNYGVSMIDLRRIADRYSKSHNFAKLLWQKGWRETYILSTLIDNEEAYTVDLLKAKVDSSPTFEVLEQLAYNMAWKLDLIDDYCKIVNNWQDELKQYFIIKVSTYQLMNKKLDASSVWKRIASLTFSDKAAILNILQNLLLRITANENSLHPDVVKYCSDYNGDAWATLTEVVREYGVL